MGKSALTRSPHLGEALRQREEALQQMKRELRAEFDEFEREIMEVARSNILHFHQMGELAHRVQSDQRRYGETAVELIAEASLHDAGTVYHAIALYQWMPRPRRLGPASRPARPEWHVPVLGTSRSTLAI